MTTTTYWIPAVFGLKYTTQGQLLRPDAEAKIKTQQGPALAKTRRTHQFGLLLQNTTGDVEIGTDFTHTTKVSLQQNGVVYDATELFSGVVWDAINDNTSFDSQLAWQVTRPTPLTVCAAAQFIETQER
jgi:hypothetical protein